MLGEFRTFIARGNVLDLAVGVIIGAAFGTIVSSLTDDVIMPFISLITGGGVDFSSKFVVLSGGDGRVFESLAQAKAAGANVLAWGSFVTAVINFLILAFVIFLIIRQANRLMPPPVVAGPTEIEVLVDIRNALKARPSV